MSISLDDIFNADLDDMQLAYRALPIEWHCPGRHGVIRNVAPDSEARVVRILVYFLGQRCCWRKGRDLEFVAMTKVFPPPTRPWEWCGTSILFGDWQAQEAANRERMRALQLSDRVTFAHAGKTITGIVCGFGKNRVSVLEGQRKWHVPATLLRLS